VIPTPPVLDADARVQAAAAPVPDAMVVDHQEPPSTSATSTTAVPLSPLPLTSATVQAGGMRPLPLFQRDVGHVVFRGNEEYHAG